MRELLHQRTPLFHEDFPLILLWSEKSGCTTLLKWFFYQLGLLDDALKHSDWVHDYENQVFKARDDYLLDLDRALDKQEKPVVKLVRDPYQRALSSYLSLTEKKDGEEHWSIEVRRHVRNYFYGTVGGPTDSRIASTSSGYKKPGSTSAMSISHLSALPSRITSLGSRS